MIFFTKCKSVTRLVYGTGLIPWNAAIFPKILASVILKMKYSPVIPVLSFDMKRSYIVMNESSWYWATILLPNDFYLKTAMKITPKTKTFILLQDFRGGVDGRVWLACTEKGNTCVIKFAQSSGSGDSDEARKSRLEVESKNWKRVNGIDTFVAKIGGEYALVMPYYKPVLLNMEIENLDLSTKNAVTDAIDKLAKLNLSHNDLKWAHVCLFFNIFFN
jgi:hypothetical protein